MNKANLDRMGMTPETACWLDFCRVFATLLVLFNHSININMGASYGLGGFGVVVFFLLSGFLITLSALRKIESGTPKALSGFLSMRIARIYTPFVPALILVALVNEKLVDQNWGIKGVNEGWYAFFGNLLLLINFPTFQAATKFGDVWSYYVRPYNTAEPFWTVAIEYWIYVFISIFIFWLVRGEKCRILSCLPLLIVSGLVVVWNSFAGAGDALFLTWLVGAGFALIFNFIHKNYMRVSNTIGLSLLIYGALCLPVRLLENDFGAYDIPTSVFLGCIVFSPLFLSRYFYFPLRLRYVCTFFASFSYSLYLIHNTVIILVYSYAPFNYYGKIIISVFLSVFIAFLFYFLFEKHYRYIARKIEPSVAKLVYR